MAFLLHVGAAVPTLHQPQIFQQESLLSTGGPAPLERLLTEQWTEERALENNFYREYQAYRQEVFNALALANPDFKGTRGKLVRFTQRFLDRCIFILFCEDMGAALEFPPNILRDVLAHVSADPDYDPNDDAAWLLLKQLFVAMRDGNPFRDHRINRFNGGLFAPDPELEALHVPTRLFCARGQRADPEAQNLHPKTLLFFSASYNFGVSGGTLERTIGLRMLGRIFEQSITELEFMEAKAEGRASISELSRRKRDGVYYTPEWITSYLVEETVGAHLAEIRRALALDPPAVFVDDELLHYQMARASGRKDKRFNTERVERYMASLDRFGAELDDLKVVDPACGAGAFLIQALDRLVNERRWLASERARVSGTAVLWDGDTVTKAVLANNIYGVDINEESIELTRLALWLHTALPDRPLSSLDSNIRCGNSLIDQQFYEFKQGKLFNEEERERINAFDWRAAFPEVFDRPEGKSGFDCVVGNPPYVKLQHFREVLPDVAEYLLLATKTTPDGSTPLYSSTQTQNFDIYLPFIEKGIELLNENGRMGFIAPNVWLRSEYGEGLRRQIRETRRLERWVDFRDYPVFDEAMTYTALQFYRGKPNDAVRCAFAPDGELGAIEWGNPDALIPYAELPENSAWVLLPERERALLERLRATCARLDAVATDIIVGIQTSADHIYHLQRLGPGRYRHFPKKKPPVEVELEDALMRPLVSGEEAKRYQAPATETCVLFPYAESGGRMRLFTAREMASRFPKAWRYLRTYEGELRKRERGAFSDEQWFRFGRQQNIDKQNLSKLGVAQTVPEMRVFYDERGAYCFNNVRVNAILSGSEESSFFLMGVLNSRVVDFVFRRIAKPKERRPSGAYFEANKQYIAPLPIPRASDEDKKQIADMARELERLHSGRRDTIGALEQRLNSEQMLATPRLPRWLWADVGAHLAEIDGAISFGAAMSAGLVDGELRFYVGDRCIISGVYVDEREGPQILSQWRRTARDTFVSDSVNAARIVAWLLDLKTTENAALIGQIDELNRSLEALEAEIRGRERALDDLAYDLYGLSGEERLMVEADTQARWDARMPMPPA